jgi:hypothetical protein
MPGETPALRVERLLLHALRPPARRDKSVACGLTVVVRRKLGSPGTESAPCRRTMLSQVAEREKQLSAADTEFTSKGEPPKCLAGSTMTLTGTADTPAQRAAVPSRPTELGGRKKNS